MTTESYADALEKALNYVVPSDGANVVQMIADKHAEVSFVSRGFVGRMRYPDRYHIRLTDAGKAALRAHGRFRK